MNTKCFTIEIYEDGRVFFAQLTEVGEERRTEIDSEENWTDWEEFPNLDEAIERLRKA